MFRSILILTALLTGVASAQTLTWKNYSSMYDVNAITVTGGKVWAATTGGVFSYSPQTGTFNQLTSTEGLSNITATAIAVDSGGSIFVGESDGSIDEVNSAGEVTRSQRDITNSSFLSKEITNLDVSGDTLFACTPFGVVLISRGTFQSLNTYSHFVPNQSTVQANAATVYHGNIYVASQFGISFGPQSAVNLAAPDQWNNIDSAGFSSGVNALAVFAGKLFIGANQGLFMSSDGVTFQQVASFSSPVLGLTAGQNFLLVNSTSGLYEVNSDLTLNQIYSSSGLNDVASYSDTLAYAATSSGILAIGSSTNRILPPGPATNQITQMAIDNKGNLWCSTSSGANTGAAFMEFNGSDWINYTKALIPSLPLDSTYYRVSAVCGDRIILGSWGYGMTMLQGDSVTVFNSTNSGLVGVQEQPLYLLAGNAACDANGNIWITNPLAYNGNVLTVFSPKDSTWHEYNYGNQTGPFSGGFNTIAIDALGGVWIGDGQGDEQGNYHGLMYYNPNGPLSNPANAEAYLFTTSDGLLSNHVNDVIVDSDQNVWVGTDLGMDLIYYDPSSSPPTLTIQYVYPLLDQNIRAIDYDALDHKWVATYSGVYEMSRDGFTRIAAYDDSNSPLPSNTVYSVACDRTNGKVYFATPDGVTELNIGIVQPQQNFSKLKIFPDPAKLPLRDPIQIQNLVANSEIKIFTVNGRLVNQFQAQGGNVAYWYGTDQSGNLLPSGIYIVVAHSSDGSQSTISKIALIRH